jgi:glycosyltransferase involved in cell wall biosynthesis
MTGTEAPTGSPLRLSCQPVCTLSGVHIGVVIPAFNAASWIGDAMVSVLAQTHRDWSLVVVDDGSTDGTSAVAAGFADRRIALIRQPNAGVSAARNRGIGELLDRSAAILFLDADDWLAPDALSRLAATLDASRGAIAAVGPFAVAPSRIVRRPPSGDLLQRLLVRNLFANGGHLLLRSEALRMAGGFVTGIAYGEDWEFWIRIALQGRFTASPGRAPVLFVRQHPGSACHRLAFDPAAYAPCMDAIFGNPALLARFGRERLAAIRQRTEAENDWITGRELIRHGRAGEGRAWLRRSVRVHPTARRVVLLAVAELLPLLPIALRGQFRPYRLLEQTALR